ncbi:head-tail connector protein [Methylobacterium oryzihabitans]|uniref:Phage gp6-like head-tail connector protein n=1 Tax=Methylobacterium oryzihabitans TaxID=2499852 RepID=A0A437P5I0_9HYPH|nr:head-tail connector protein [Methylobacterium oryzihabitans]RVU17492.1 phage gp6-like head-tail connector protein [Methylobacterium oryzihabitans]
MLSYRRVTAPAGSVLSAAELRRHLRLDEADADPAELAAAIAGAEEHLDGYDGELRHALLEQDWEAVAPGPGPCGLGEARGFLIDLAPIADVVSVEFLSGGAYQPLGAWRELYPFRRRCVALLPAAGGAWPVADPDPAAWRIRFRAGYPDAAAVPGPIRAALLLVAGDLFDNRGARQPASLADNPTLERLLARFRPSEA